MNSYENGLHTEVIDLENEHAVCHELVKSSYPAQGATGGLINGKPMICGGFYEDPLTGGSNRCFIAGETETQPITMASGRSYPASISISRDKAS